MSVLGLVSYTLVKLRGMLPRDPCSIASTMVYLAGSQLCDRDASIMPQSAELMDEKEPKNVLEGWVFSLGWWNVARVDGEEASTAEEQEVSLGSGNYATAIITEDTDKRFGVDVGSASNLALSPDTES